MHDADGELLALRALEKLDETPRIPRHVVTIRRYRLDRDHLAHQELGVRGAIPWIERNSCFLEKHVGRPFHAGLCEKSGAELGVVLFKQDDTEGCHAATSSAASMRRSMVQMPSVPGRH